MMGTEASPDPRILIGYQGTYFFLDCKFVTWLCVRVVAFGCQDDVSRLLTRNHIMSWEALFADFTRFVGRIQLPKVAVISARGLMHVDARLSTRSVLVVQKTFRDALRIGLLKAVCCNTSQPGDV